MDGAKEKRNGTYGDALFMAGVGLALLFSALLLQTAARRMPEMAEAYAVGVYPWLVKLYGGYCGLFPVSASEMGLYLLLFLAAAGLIRLLRARRLELAAGAAVLTAGILGLAYVLGCGINYYRQPFSSYLELEMRESSPEELRELCVWLTRQVCASENHDAYSREWEEEGQKAMEALGETYPQLAGNYPRPKGLAGSWILSVQQLSGVYSPFTVEANYNRDMTDYNIPHTICHELSHLKGFMREDEANFIGYLACIRSEHPAFRYSGYLTGWIYACNALAAEDPETYSQLRQQLSPAVQQQLQENNAFWDRYEGKAAEAASRINDSYLKFHQQEDGVKSYGRMVDLMLAYYRQETGG